MTPKRSHQKEWIDLGPPNYTSQEYRSCLYQLDRIGQCLGGDRATFKALKQLKMTPSSILDVGCGGGLFTLRLAARYPKTRIVGMDIAEEAIAFAQEHLKSTNLAHVQFMIPASKSLKDLPDQYDVLISTLVCHHLADDELIAFLKQAAEKANQAVIINDLHRHPLATVGFGALAPILFPNRLIYHDGLLSIRRAFTRRDWIYYLEAAGFSAQNYTIAWHWPFRWIIIIKGINSA